MPWKACTNMNEKIKFVARLLDGEKMAPLGREFGISRKTGYKIFDRYKDHGLEGLNDRSRKPIRYANQLPFQVEKAIIQIKKKTSLHGVLLKSVSNLFESILKLKHRHKVLSMQF